jgi:hypothetical protein
LAKISVKSLQISSPSLDLPSSSARSLRVN